MKSFLLLLTCLATLSCRQQPKENEDLREVKKQLTALSEENRKLQQEISDLRTELAAERVARETADSNQAVQKAPEPGMTTERVKIELAPLMKDAIQKAKASMETPKKGKGYGMRVEFDMNRAVYGLVRTDDPANPYRAKVIVTYEKFLESDDNSKSYGNGTLLFEFAYDQDRWVLLKQNQ